MAATYTEISLEDMEKFLKRAFRALRPKQTLMRGEVVYDLAISPNVAIRVYTSIHRGSGMGAGKGSDSIKLLLWGSKANRPLTKGKAAPIVKRTAGWRDALQDRIETMMELYEEKESYWESVGGGGQAPSRVQEDDQDLEDEDATPSAPPPAPTSGPFEGTFTKSNDGGWAAKITGRGEPGARAFLTTKGGRKVPVNLIKKLWSGQDHYGAGYVEIWTIEESRRMANYDYDRS